MAMRLRRVSAARAVDRRSRHSQQNRKHKGLVVVAVLSMAAAMGTWGVTPANAVHATGAFELDGNATNDSAVPGDDWSNVCHQVSPTACPSGSNTSGATAVSWAAEPNLNSSIFTGGGSKDPIDVSSWAWKDGAGGLPDKDNLLHSFAARYSLAPNAATCPSNGAATCEVLFFGSDRYDNSGDAQQAFWFFQNAIGLGSNPVGGGSGFTGVHRNGDVLVISDFSNGGTTSTITVYKWDSTCKKAGGSCGDANLRILESSDSAKCSSTLAATDQFCGIVNPADGTASPWSFTDKSGNSTFLNGEFYEGGINLSTLGLANECFSSVTSETRSSTSTTAVLKDFVLGGFGSCGSSTVTTPSDGSGTAVPASGLSIGTGSVSAKDAARITVTGTSVWAGNVQFSLCGPSAISGCASGAGTAIGSPVAVTNATPQPILSPAATITSAGSYCWRADFDASTTGVPDSSDGAVTECFTVNPVQPTLSTSAGPDVILGNPVTDSATLSGTANQPGTPVINPTTAGGPAGGTITFSLYGPSTTGCGSLVGTVTPATNVSGDNTYGPVSLTPTAIGTYHWVATYSGDSPNTLGVTHNSACTDSAEDVVVGAAPSSLTSAQSFIPNDRVTVSASQGGAPTGSVLFELFENATCTGTPVYTQTVAVTAASATVGTTNTTVSTTSPNVSWQVTYTSSNAAQRSIPATCLEKSTLTIDNGGTATSP
jgi:hypothetical protein